MTHTASVAALADQHLVVDKATLDKRQGVGTSACDTTAPLPGVDVNSSPLTAWRSRRHGSFDDGTRGVCVSIHEVQGCEREDEVARMAAGDMGGVAASELAREMLRYSRRRISSAAANPPP